MEILYNILMVLFVIVSVVMAVLVMLQEGKSNGLGSLGGASSSGDTFWGKNKARSAEGMMQRITTILMIAFFVLALLLNSKIFN